MADAFIMTRELAAPRDLVWRAHTEREHLLRWWGPKGCRLVAADIDARPGGLFHYGMETPDGAVMWGKWVFRDIRAPDLLDLVVAFSDEQRGETRHPLAPTWPIFMHSVTRLEEQDGRTKLHIELTPEGANEQERATFAVSHDSLRMGFGGTYDQLAAYLAELQSGAG